MKPMRLFCLMSALGLLALWGASSALGGYVSQKGKARAKNGISVDQFTAELKKRGFEVAKGDFRLWGIEECPQCLVGVISLP